MSTSTHPSLLLWYVFIESLVAFEQKGQRIEKEKQGNSIDDEGVDQGSDIAVTLLLWYVFIESLVAFEQKGQRIEKRKTRQLN